MFEKIIEGILKREGGYANNHLDKGGKTMYGITEAVARGYGYKGEIKDLPLSTAKEIYKKQYWRKEFEILDYDIAEFLMDCNVNHGYKGMSLILQRAINLDIKNRVEVDGYAGKNTYTAATKIKANRLYLFLQATRCNYYISICNNNESQKTFIYGWLKDRIFWKKAGIK